MHQRRLLVIGAAAVVVSGLFTVFMYRSFLNKVARTKPAMATVVVAARDLPMGAMITDTDVRTAELPGRDLPQNVVTDPKKIVGRGLLAPMVKNEIVLLSKLAAEKAGAGLPSLIPPNMRAVSVQVNDVIAVAGFVVPGTRVDVLLTGSPKSASSTAEIMTTTVLENVEVLAAGQKIQPNAEGKPDKVPVITLLVSPQDAQRLTLGSSQGKIQLSLRNPLDERKGEVDPVENASLYRGGAPAPAPAPKRHVAKRAAEPVAEPSPMYALEVIRGDKREVTKF